MINDLIRPVNDKKKKTKDIIARVIQRKKRNLLLTLCLERGKSPPFKPGHLGGKQGSIPQVDIDRIQYLSFVGDKL